MLNRIWGRREPTIEAEGVFETMATLEPPPPRWPALRLSRIASSIDTASIARALPILGVMLIALALNWPTLHDYFHGDDFVAFTELGTKKPLAVPVRCLLLQGRELLLAAARPGVLPRPLSRLRPRPGCLPRAEHRDVHGDDLADLPLLPERGALTLGCAGSAALFAIVPSHVVSVAWVTNSPRVMAVMFFMASLVVLQKALAKKSLPLDVLAWFLFLLCPLADETSMALAPIPVLYSAIYSGRLKIDGPVIARLVIYAAVVAALAPLQFMYTLDDEPRLADYSFGPHVLEQAWALTSQMVLPLATGSPLALSFQAIGPVQWAAGAIAIAPADCCWSLAPGRCGCWQSGPLLRWRRLRSGTSSGSHRATSIWRQSPTRSALPGS